MRRSPKPRKMARLLLLIDAEKEAIFRRIAAEKYGFKRGFIQRALNEAIDLWIQENENGRRVAVAMH